MKPELCLRILAGEFAKTPLQRGELSAPTRLASRVCRDPCSMPCQQPHALQGDRQHQLARGIVVGPQLYCEETSQHYDVQAAFLSRFKPWLQLGQPPLATMVMTFLTSLSYSHFEHSSTSSHPKEAKLAHGFMPKHWNTGTSKQ